MKVFLLAGEASGDKLGGALMAGLKQLQPDVTFEGIGGVEMAAQGLVSQFDMSELSVMGLAEVLPKYRHLKRRIQQTADAVLALKPDVLITIDSPDFSLRVAKLVKAKSDIKTIHYVAPSVWAWRAGRAAKMAKVIDHVLALLPFEPPYMTDAGMTCDFVGHPIVAEPVASDADAHAFRATHGLGQAPVLIALPGSRRSEVARLAPIFGKALKLVLHEIPDLRIVVPAGSGVVAQVHDAIADWPGSPVLLDPGTQTLDQSLDQKRAAMKAADVALAASGTVSLELAAAGTPMVIAYDMNWLTRHIIQRMVRVDTVTLVNLVSDTRAVPEFIGKNCTPEGIAQGVVKLMRDPQTQQVAMQKTMQLLGQGGEGPGLQAARSVLAHL